MKKKIGEILLEKGWTSEDHIKRALDYQEANKCKIGEALVKLGHVTQERLSRALAIQCKLPFANLSKHQIPKELIDRVPKDVALEHRIVPVAQKGKTLIIAMSDPLDFFTLDNLRFILNTEVDCALATPESVDQALDDYYRLSGDYDSVLGDSATEETQVEFGRGEYTGEDSEVDDAPVIRFQQLSFDYSRPIHDRAVTSQKPVVASEGQSLQNLSLLIHAVNSLRIPRQEWSDIHDLVIGRALKNAAGKRSSLVRETVHLDCSPLDL